MVVVEVTFLELVAAVLVLDGVVNATLEDPMTFIMAEIAKTRTDHPFLGFTSFEVRCQCLWMQDIQLVTIYHFESRH